MTHQAGNNADLLRSARDLVAALEHQDATAEAAAMHAILGVQESRLHGNLTRIAAELRDALSASQYGRELSRLAKTELPGAQQRLNRVIELTESAANTCLSAVESAMPLVRRIQAQIGADGDAVQLAADAAGIEKCLSEILMAQGFQDITGQIIRRITRLVAELEEQMSACGIDVSGGDRQGASDAFANGSGPSVPGLDNGALEQQQDVDDLLGQLGL